MKYIHIKKHKSKYTKCSVCGSPDLFQKDLCYQHQMEVNLNKQRKRTGLPEINYREVVTCSHCNVEKTMSDMNIRLSVKSTANLLFCKECVTEQKSMGKRFCIDCGEVINDTYNQPRCRECHCTFKGILRKRNYKTATDVHGNPIIPMTWEEMKQWNVDNPVVISEHFKSVANMLATNSYQQNAWY